MGQKYFAEEKKGPERRVEGSPTCSSQRRSQKNSWGRGQENHPPPTSKRKKASQVKGRGNDSAVCQGTRDGKSEENRAKLTICPRVYFHEYAFSEVKVFGGGSQALADEGDALKNQGDTFGSFGKGKKAGNLEQPQKN